jgi:hypothetical protein
MVLIPKVWVATVRPTLLGEEPIIYTFHMSNHEDRSPLLLKVALRQALHRMQDEADAFSQYEALAGNLGWDEVADAAAATRKAMVEALERAEDAVEAAVKVQAESAHDHVHPGGHEHDHTHTHSHPHEHSDGHEHPEG